MQSKRLGRHTVRLAGTVSVVSFANVGGRLESQGPLAEYFDELSQDSYFGSKSWEQAESLMQVHALHRALAKGGLEETELDYVLAGDLLNQCIGTSFSMRDFSIPFYGLYGACSTMGESLALAAMLIDGGFARFAAAMTSSHFCTAVSDAASLWQPAHSHCPVDGYRCRMLHSGGTGGGALCDPCGLRTDPGSGDSGCQQYGRGDGAGSL